MRLATITKRSDFLAANHGRKCVTGTFILQMRPRGDEEAARFGFTVTKKMGGAVKRNRIKRRLREAVRKIAPKLALPGHDYVLIARSKALACDFPVLLRDMEFAF